MAKDPAMLFYSADFMMAAMVLSMEERGQYITLLCIMHQQGRLTEEEINTVLMGKVSEKILKKFEKDSENKYFNERLEFETNRRKEFSKSRRNSLDITNNDMVHLYIVKAPDQELYKIGSSKYPALRLKEVVKYKPGSEFYWISEGLHERINEKNLHEKYAEKREKYDWFLLDSKDLENIKESFRTVTVTENVNTILSKEKKEPDLFWTTQVRLFFNDFRWKEKFCRDKSVPIKVLEQRMKAFIQDRELTEDFKELKELKSHFLHWFNKNKDFPTGQKVGFHQPSAPPLTNASNV